MEISPTSASWFIMNVQPFIGITLLCTTKKHHPLRWLNVLVLAALTVVHGKYINLIGMATADEVAQRITPLPTLLHTTVLFAGIDYEDLYAQHAPQYRGSRLANFWAAMRLTLDYSAVGTRWQVRNVAPMPAWLTPNPRRTVFVARQLAVMAWQYLMLDFLQRVLREREDVWSELLAVLRDPAVAQSHSWLFEAAVNLVTWFVLARLCLDFKWRALSVVTVATHISDPTGWLPMFGSSFEAYTVRNFWGKYWHQQLRWPLNATASFVLRDILRLPHPSVVERYSNIFLCFLVSGFIHLAAQYKGSTFEKSGAVRFFASFTLAIMVEDGVQALWKRLVSGVGDGNRDDGRNGHKASPKRVKPALWKRMVGYVWTLSCLVALGPFYSYDMAYIALIEPMALPIDLTNLLGVQTTVAVLGAGLVFGMVFLGAEP